jgi:hypothetical protein
MTTLQSVPHAANVGQIGKNCENCSRKTLSQLAGSGQVKTFHADKKPVEQQRAEEKPRVYQAQLERVHKQIRAYYIYGDIGRWPEIATDE